MVEAYDFENPKKPELKDQPASLAFNERFARSFAALATKQLKQDYQCKFIDQQAIPLKTSFNKPSKYILIQEQDSKAYLLACISNACFENYVSCLLGGQPHSNRDSHAEDQPLSPFDSKHGLILGELLCQALEQTWQRHLKLKLRVCSVEDNLKFFTQFSENDQFQQVNFETSYSKTQTSTFSILKSQKFEQLVKPHMILSKSEFSNDSSWLKKLASHISRSKVDIKVQLGEAEVLVEDLIKLHVGDVIQLDEFADRPLKVFVEGQHKFDAKPGLVKGHRAVKII